MKSFIESVCLMTKNPGMESEDITAHTSMKASTLEICSTGTEESFGLTEGSTKDNGETTRTSAKEQKLEETARSEKAGGLEINSLVTKSQKTGLESFQEWHDL